MPRPRHPILPADRYVKQPRRGETLNTSRYEMVTVLEVHDRGRRLLVRDRIGREHVMERAEIGYWIRPRGESRTRGLLGRTGARTARRRGAR